jgi:hypothetical protein
LIDQIISLPLAAQELIVCEYRALAGEPSAMFLMSQNFVQSFLFFPSYL